MRSYRDNVQNQNGVPVVSPTITVYLQGTGTAATLYSDAAGTSLANPFTGDARGNFEFFVVDGRYDINLSGGTPPITSFTIYDVEIADVTSQTAADTTWEVDDITVNSDLNLGADVNLTRSAANTLLLASGDKLLLQNLDGTRFANQFTGADMAAKIAAAIADLPSTGGRVDARGLEGAQAAATNPFASVAKSVTLLLGDTTITATTAWNVNANSNIIGLGAKRTVFDFAGATGAFTNGGCIHAGGAGLTALPALAANITAGTKTITLATAPSVVQGDVVVIYDATDSSYSGFRTYYRAGEYALVDSVAGVVITLAEPILGETYVNDGSVTVYKLNTTSSTLRDFKVIGRGDTPANSTACLMVEYGHRAKVIDVEATNSRYAGVSVSRSFSTEVQRLKADKSLADLDGTSYALVISNSQDINVRDSDLLAVRHGLAVGGADQVGGVVNRGIRVTNNRIRTLSASLFALDFHGNTELSVMDGNVVDGIDIGGNKNRVSNNLIYDVAGWGVYLTEMKGMDFEIVGNTYYGVRDPVAGCGYFVDVGGSDNPLQANTTLGGVLNISDNRVRFSVADSAQKAIVITNRGSTAAGMHVVVANNNFVGTKTSTGNQYAFFQRIVSGDMFDSVLVKDNFAYAMGYAIWGADFIEVSGNTSLDSGVQGIYLLADGPTTPVKWIVRDNVIGGAQTTGIRIEGAAAQVVGFIQASGNFSTENNLVYSGSTLNDTALKVRYATIARVKDNHLGGTQVEQDYPAYYGTITTLLEGGNYYFGTGTPQYVTVTNRAQWAQQAASGGDITVASSGAMLVKRLKTSIGTALVAGDFALSAGWGSTAAVSAVTGTDQGFDFTITTGGTGIGASPTITLTFKDGTWTNSPILLIQQRGGTGAMPTQITYTPSATTPVITWVGTPVTANTYIFSVICMGR